MHEAAAATARVQVRRDPILEMFCSARQVVTREFRQTLDIIVHY